jgi:chromosome segregation ATPase
LEENQQQQGELQEELDAAQKQLKMLHEKYLDEQSRLEARTKELESAKVVVEEQVRRLNEALAEEIKRREGAEQEAGEISQRRSELEAELARNQQIQARLQQQLDEASKQLIVIKHNYQSEQSRLEARSKDLLTAQRPVD